MYRGWIEWSGGEIVRKFKYNKLIVVLESVVIFTLFPILLLLFANIVWSVEINNITLVLPVLILWVAINLLVLRELGSFFMIDDSGLTRQSKLITRSITWVNISEIKYSKFRNKLTLYDNNGFKFILYYGIDDYKELYPLLYDKLLEKELTNLVPELFEHQFK